MHVLFKSSSVAKGGLIPPPRFLTPSSGFTLVEMAVVIVIIGIIMMTVFPALKAVRTANQYALTQSNLHSLMLATAAYVQANGCLPCPANPATVSTTFGTTSNGAACGSISTTGTVTNACATPEGIPPFVALGIPAATAHDGWGHWITMRVDPALTLLPGNATTCGTTGTCSVFIPPTSTCLLSDYNNNTAKDIFCAAKSGSPVGYADKGLCQYNLSASAQANPVRVTTLAGATQKAAVIFVSHGSTGYGSYYAQAMTSGIGSNGVPLAFPSDYAPCNSGSYAVCNGAATNSPQFYDAPASIGKNGLGITTYDDILAYADRNTLVSMLGNGACATVW